MTEPRPEKPFPGGEEYESRDCEGEGGEGEDYYMDGPYLVFTAAYHRKRGFCCHSDCRHCPYGASLTPAATQK